MVVVDVDDEVVEDVVIVVEVEDVVDDVEELVDDEVDEDDEDGWVDDEVDDDVVGLLVAVLTGAVVCCGRALPPPPGPAVRNKAAKRAIIAIMNIAGRNSTMCMLDSF